MNWLTEGEKKLKGNKENEWNNKLRKRINGWYGKGEERNDAEMKRIRRAKQKPTTH